MTLTILSQVLVVILAVFVIQCTRVENKIQKWVKIRILNIRNSTLRYGNEMYLCPKN